MSGDDADLVIVRPETTKLVMDAFRARKRQSLLEIAQTTGLEVRQILGVLWWARQALRAVVVFYTDGTVYYPFRAWRAAEG